MESELTHYRNGPLPDDLEAAAYFTEDRKEWALPKAESFRYLDWCERERRGCNPCVPRAGSL